MERIAAIILAAGSGRRMGTGIHKQYLTLAGRPMICHTLAAFEESPADDIILVTGAGEEEYCRENIVEKFGFTKVRRIVAGGKERYHSVYEGLKAAAGSDYVLIHDGARPCVTDAVIRAVIDGVRTYGACVAAVPVTDTIKIADADGFAAAGPPRSTLWAVQTPQAFVYEQILNAYREVLNGETRGITDDTMVLEAAAGKKAKLVQGSYENIKVTTPEDLAAAEAFLSRRKRVSGLTRSPDC